jgi:hypothetical protein
VEVDGVMQNEPRRSLDRMPTLIKDPPPAGFEELLERRRQLGQDLLDEMWEGVYHMNPAPAKYAAGQLSYAVANTAILSNGPSRRGCRD